MLPAPSSSRGGKAILMQRLMYDKTGTRLIRTEEAEPKCGKDYCEDCGDCLACNAGYTCYLNDDDGEHRWIVYEDEEELK